MTMQELIRNSVKYQVGHEPTELEIRKVIEYLAENTTDKATFTDYDYEILMWREKNTVDCAWCGNDWLPQEMEYNTEYGEHFCCEQCKKDWETEHGKAI